MDAEKSPATAKILEWAGVASTSFQETPSSAKPLAKFDAKY